MEKSMVSLHDLVNYADLKKLQDIFCKVSGATCACYDGNMNVVCCAGDFLPKEELEVFLQSKLVMQMIESVGDGSLEDISIERRTVGSEELDAYIASMSIRIKQGIICYWVVLVRTETEEQTLYDWLDFLKLASDSYFAGREEVHDAEQESSRSKGAEAEMGRAVHSQAATSAIVSLLDNSSMEISQVLNRWLHIVRDYLQADRAHIFRLTDGGFTAEVLGEALKVGMISLYNLNESNPSYDFMRTDKPLIISADRIMADENRLIAEMGIRALMVFPLIRKSGTEDGNMVAVIGYDSENHFWSEEEITFAKGAAKIMQTILVDRINRNSLAGSIHALEEILNHIGSSVYLTNRRTGRVLFVNKILERNFGEEWKDGSLLELISKGDFSNPDSGSFEIHHEDRDRWYDLIYKNISWVDGSPARLCTLYDITERKHYQRKIEQQAYTDFLTGLYNRMCCERDLAKLMDDAQRTGEKGALIYLDLDDFKHINDGLGHQYGDVLLKSISGALCNVEGIERTCYRVGGDEFIILIPPRFFWREEGIIEDIKSVFSKPWFLKDTDYYCTASVGVVYFPTAGDSVADLIKKADIAMYEAKKGGKNRLSIYSEGQESVSGRRLDMEKNMRDAENTDYIEFEVYYQPIVDIEDGKEICAGAEALVRWNSPKLGFISPGDFIPLAEYLGLINPIGGHVLKSACLACKGWNDNGHPNMKVNVNLSVVQLLQNDIVEQVEQTLQETGLNPKNLTLEVTESLAINDMPRMQGILGRIKKLGISIALDDFGTGYSSLNHIREIPFDVIKVDQSFVKELAMDAYSQSFVKMVAELAQTIGVKICVEGIETENQYKVLTDMKVKYVQGYYFNKPLPKNVFEKQYVL